MGDKEHNYVRKVLGLIASALKQRLQKAGQLLLTRK